MPSESADESTDAELDRLMTKGDNLWDAGDGDRAREAYEEAIRVAASQGNAFAIAVLLGNLGNIALHEGRAAEAAHYYERAVRAYQMAGDRAWVVRMLTSWGNALETLGDYATARARHQEAIDVAADLGDTEWQGRATNNLGNAYGRDGLFAEASEHHTAALHLAVEADDAELLAMAQRALYTDFKAMHGDATALVYTHAALGRAYFQAGRAGEAAAQFEELLKHLDPDHNRRPYAEFLEALADSRAAAREYDAEEAARQELLTHIAALGDAEWLATSLGNLGSHYFKRGRWNDATSQFEEQLALALLAKDVRNRASAAGSLGNLCFRLGNHALALEYLGTQLELATKHELHQMKVNALTNLGATWMGLGEDRRARRYLEEALIADEALADHDSSRPNILGNLGTLAMRRGDLGGADAHFAAAREALPTSSDGYAERELRHNTALLRARQRRWPEAEDLLARALIDATNARDARGVASAMTNLGVVGRQTQGDEAALPMLEGALVQAKRVNDLPLIARAATAWAEAQMALGSLDGAEEALQLAVATLERLGGRLDDETSIHLFASQGEPFALLQRLLVDARRHGEALEIAERSRGRALRRLLAQRQAPGRRVRDMKSILQRAAYQAIFVVDASSPVHIDRNALRTVLARTALPNNEPEPRPAPTVASMLATAAAHDTAILSYSSLGKRRIGVWLLRDGALRYGEAAVPSVDDTDETEETDETSLKRLVDSWRDTLLSNDDPNDADGAARERAALRAAYDLLVAPVEEWLPHDANARLCVVPTGALFALPFPALLDRHGRALVDRYALFEATSIDALDLSRQALKRRLAETTDAALVVGNPTGARVPRTLGGDDVVLPSLRFAAQEARDIAKLTGATPLIGKDATRASVCQRLPTARIVHLAAHALVYGADPLTSAILLSPEHADGGDDDGALTARDLQEMTLRGSLVVLSGCSTVLGSITGDGVAGLARALIVAGASSVIVSRWAVADSATYDLMVELYRGVRRGLGLVHALQGAMRSTRDGWRAASSWSGFVLHGQPGDAMARDMEATNLANVAPH